MPKSPEDQISAAANVGAKIRKIAVLGFRAVGKLFVALLPSYPH